MKDYYKILGVAPASSTDEIKKAYRLLAFRYHPDRNEGDIGSEELFKEIAESYTVLSNIVSRQDYDYLIANPHKSRKDFNPYAEKSSATFLIIFKDIKKRVFHAGGYINKYALFKHIDQALSPENIEFLISSGDTITINLIIDEILIAGVFLNTEGKRAVHDKLLQLANGDARTIERVTIIKQGAESHFYDAPSSAKAEETATNAYFFILLMIILIVLMLL